LAIIQIYAKIPILNRKCGPNLWKFPIISEPDIGFQ
jgi:hypothetical protein